MWSDPIVEETRKIRDEIAARFNYDVEALGRYYQEQQAKENRVVIRRVTRCKMERKDQSIKATLSERQFVELCNDVATEASEVWALNPQLEKKTALLSRLQTRVQTKLLFFPIGFVAHEGKTPEETAYRSALDNVCNVLTYFGKVAIDFDCPETIARELFDKVRE